MAVQRLASIDAALEWLAGRGVRALRTDSRLVEPGDAFIAWPGQSVDGRHFISQALTAGAVACLVEADGAEALVAEFAEPEPGQVDHGDAVASLPDLKAATGPLASAFFGRPSDHLTVLAVTGTNGKTSIAWWLAQAFSSVGERCGMIGTLGIGEPPSPLQAEVLAPTGLTTPGPVTLQAGLKRFVDAGLTTCAVEATSIGIEEHRLAGTHIAVALFSNFTLDHLDYHGSVSQYWQAKARLFAWPGLRAAVVNLDDLRGASLIEAIDREKVDLWTYSAVTDARLLASNVAYEGGGLRFDVREGDQVVNVKTRMIGDYNISNLLATIAGLRACEVPLVDAAAACALLTPVPGRMQRVPSGASSPQVVVDYAHTPDALEKALLALQPFAAERGGLLWCVFGCGGNRDTGKRPLMGAIAQRLAGRVVVTSDNPRHEDTAAIVAQIVAGFTDDRQQLAVIADRRAAIAQAVGLADPRDVILIAGKGHEDYQLIGDVRQPFSDFDEALAALGVRETAGSSESAAP